MNWELLAEVVVGLVVTTGLGGYLVKRVEEWRYRQGVRRHVQGLRDLGSVFNALEKLRVSSGALRAMLIRSRNNGGVPSPGCEVKVKILYESIRGAGDSGKEKWDEREADEHYQRLLLRIIEAEHVVMRTEDLPECSELRVLYDSSGTIWSKVDLVHTSPDEMLYVSVNYDTDEELSETQRTIYAQCLHDLRRIFSHYRGGGLEDVVVD